MAPRFRDVLLVLAAFGLCPVAALLIGDDATEPLARARALADAEAAVGLHVEPALHAWVAGHGALDLAARAFYVAAHVPVTAWALIWTACLRPDACARIRNLFLATQVLVVVLWVLVPTAPPWLMDAPDMRPGGVVSAVQSPYAAIPSGHVAFALIAGATFARYGDRHWLRGFGRVYPPLAVLVTVVTANHLLADAAAAALVVGVAWALTGSVRVPLPRRAARPREADALG
jgi:hypothetical protein